MSEKEYTKEEVREIAFEAAKGGYRAARYRGQFQPGKIEGLQERALLSSFEAWWEMGYE